MKAEIQIELVGESGNSLGTLTIWIKLHEGTTREEATRQIKDSLKRSGKLMRFASR